MSDSHPDQKVCTECDQSKALDLYSLAKRGKYGRAAICKACASGKYPQTTRTPEQKAAYRRQRGEAAGPYVPMTEKKRISKERRLREAAEAEQAKQGRETARRLALASLHNEHVKEYRNITTRWAARYKRDSEFAVKQRLRTQLRKKAKLYPKLDDLMRNAINRCGESHTVEVVCGYRIADLVARLESLFVEGMDWSAFMRGEIHIDHKRPQASFDLTDADQVRACWALSNLQPLWAADNLAKAARWDGREAA